MSSSKETKGKSNDIVLTDSNGETVIQKRKKKIPGKYEKWSARVAQRICDLITEGKTIADIGKMKTMPDKRTIYYWRRNYPEFKKASDQAREDRAEYFADKVVEVADNLTTKSKAPVAKVKIEAYRWRASVDNPERYGNKKDGMGGSDPITIVINTGIQREEKVVDADQGDLNGVHAASTSGGITPESEEI